MDNAGFLKSAQFDGCSDAKNNKLFGGGGGNVKTGWIESKTAVSSDISRPSQYMEDITCNKLYMHVTRYIYLRKTQPF
jgi:hypothetical protein